MLAVGPGRRNKDGDLIPPAVKEGDRVLLPEYGGAPVKLNDKEWVPFGGAGLCCAVVLVAAAAAAPGHVRFAIARPALCQSCR